MRIRVIAAIAIVSGTKFELNGYVDLQDASLSTWQKDALAQAKAREKLSEVVNKAIESETFRDTMHLRDWWQKFFAINVHLVIDELNKIRAERKDHRIWQAKVAGHITLDAGAIGATVAISLASSGTLSVPSSVATVKSFFELWRDAHKLLRSVQCVEYEILMVLCAKAHQHGAENFGFRIRKMPNAPPVETQESAIDALKMHARNLHSKRGFMHESLLQIFEEGSDLKYRLKIHAQDFKEKHPHLGKIIRGKHSHNEPSKVNIIFNNVLDGMELPNFSDHRLDDLLETHAQKCVHVDNQISRMAWWLDHNFENIRLDTLKGHFEKINERVVKAMDKRIDLREFARLFERYARDSALTLRDGHPKVEALSHLLGAAINAAIDLGLAAADVHAYKDALISLPPVISSEIGHKILEK